MELLNTILFFSTLLVGGVVLFIQVRSGATKAAADSNDILRKLVEDQKLEIDKLRTRQHELGNDMQKLQLDFETIKQERKYLAQLITLALAEHFAANPEAAKAAQAIVSGESLKPSRK